MDPARKTTAQLLQDPAFKRLVAKHWAMSLALTTIMLALYFGFILLIAYRKDLLAIKIGTATTLGIPLGVATIVLAWLLTAFYVGWANRRHDPEVRQLRDQLK